MEPGPASPPLFDLSGQPEGQLVAHTMLGSQVVELHVPGLVLDDLVGERVEDIELGRGTASLWFGPDFVQVRWFTGGQEPCESFTVTVAGGNEDANRHAAVDFAERVLLPSDLGDRGMAELDGTGWWLERSTVAGVPTDGNRAAFGFANGRATWSDGCNDFGADYTQPSPTELVLGDVSSTKLPCPTNPTSQAIAALMSSPIIEVAWGSGVDALFLTAGDITLTLRPVEPDAEADEDPDSGQAESLIGTSWILEGSRVDNGMMTPVPATDGDVGTLTFDFDFGAEAVSFSFGCNATRASVVYRGAMLSLGDGVTTQVGCNLTDLETAVARVVQSTVEVAFVGDRLELSNDGATLILRPA
jgi:heat shock protein HslJ